MSKTVISTDPPTPKICKRGHEIGGVNAQISKGGSVRCRACKKLCHSKKPRPPSDPEYMRKWRKNNPDKCKNYSKTYHSRKPEQRMLGSARERSRNLKLPPCNLDITDIVLPEFCPVLGIQLEKNKRGILDTSPSLDRHIPGLGYVKGNVFVMSMRANRIKSNGTAEEHEAIARYIREKNFESK